MKLRVLLPFAFVFIAALVRSEEKKPDNDITVNVFVNYGFAYRDKSWVPVDVLVENRLRDVKGWLEVKTIAATGDVQSPIYRVRADSPEGSRKRFRVTCYFNNTVEVRTQLYEEGRPVLDTPVLIPVSSIKPNDLLTLVIDREISDYGYMDEALQKKSSSRRVYRENLRDETVSALSQYPQCYRSLDAIVMGDMDPSRIAPAQREAIRTYIEEGGLLIVMTGMNASRFRGTWVEELSGIKIGGIETIDEADLAASLFSHEDRVGAVRGRGDVFAVLEPLGYDVELKGASRTIAIVRKVGAGRVVAIAVDASSRGLTNCVGYRRLWLELFENDKKRNLNYDTAAELTIQELPQIMGIEIQPRSSVMLYLGLYFCLAIVLNWAFFSYLKRRELAWLAMVIFSIAFTGYAIVYGNTGRAKSTEIERVNVLELPEGSSMARCSSLRGILSVRTRRFDGRLDGRHALIRDHSRTAMSYNHYVEDNFGAARPFIVEQDSTSRIDGLLVRASEMRILMAESQVPLDGSVEGSLSEDEHSIRGEFTNNTGLDIEHPQLLFFGNFYPLDTNNGKDAKTVWSIELNRRLLKTKSTSGVMRYVGVNSTAAFRNVFLYTLFVDRSFKVPTGGGYYYGTSDKFYLSEKYGAKIVGWVSRGAGNSVEPLMLDGLMNENLNETLLVADVGMSLRYGPPEPWHELYVRRQYDARYGSFEKWERGKKVEEFYWDYSNIKLKAGNRVKVEILLPDSAFDSGDAEGEIEVELYWRYKQGVKAVFFPFGEGPDWSEKNLVGEDIIKHNGMEIKRTLYHFNLRGSNARKEDKVLPCFVTAIEVPVEDSKNKRKPEIAFFVNARMKTGGGE